MPELTPPSGEELEHPASPSTLGELVRPPPNRSRAVGGAPSHTGLAASGSAQLGWIANFIWGIADDVLRDLFGRTKYRDVILPMTVLRRLDAVLEPTKQAVLDMKAMLDRAGILNQDAALRQAAGQAFYNTSKFALRDLRGRTNQH